MVKDTPQRRGGICSLLLAKRSRAPLSQKGDFHRCPLPSRRMNLVQPPLRLTTVCPFPFLARLLRLAPLSLFSPLPPFCLIPPSSTPHRTSTHSSDALCHPRGITSARPKQPNIAIALRYEKQVRHPTGTVQAAIDTSVSSVRISIIGDA